jgi:hypothetical protein
MAVRELAKYKSDLVGVQVRWGNGSSEKAKGYKFSMEKGMKIVRHRLVLYITESYQQLGEWSFLVTGSHI